MSVKYAPSKLRVPNGFQNILEGLAREILREQPENIIQYADRYFKEKLKQRAAETSTETVENDAMENTDGLQNQAKSDPPEKTSSPVDETPPADPSPTENTLADQGPSEEEAAIKIQSLIRGAQARKEVEALKAASSTSVGNEDTGANEASVEENVEANAENENVVAGEDSEGDAAAEVPASEGDAAAEVPASEGDAAAEVPASEGDATTEVPASEGDATTEVPASEGDATTEVPASEGDTTTEVQSEVPASAEDEIALDDPEVLAAATKIQAAFRGHKARKSVVELRTEVSPEVPSNVVDEEDAAVDEDSKDNTQGDDTSNEVSAVVVEGDNGIDESTANVDETTGTTEEAVTENIVNETVQEGAAVSEDNNGENTEVKQEETGDVTTVTES